MLDKSFYQMSMVKGIKNRFFVLLVTCIIFISIFWKFKVFLPFFFTSNSENKLQNFERVYAETLINIAKLKMPESKLNYRQVTEVFFRLYTQYKKRYNKDKDKIIDADLKLAKILLLSGEVRKALDIFSNLSSKEEINLQDKLYALYYTGKIQLLYLSNPKKAAPIFKYIADNYEKEHSSQTAWVVLWSKLRLAEIYENEGKLKVAQVCYDKVINDKNIEKLKIDDRVFIYTFIAEKYLLLGEIQKSLKIVEENLGICNEFKKVNFDWAYDWLIWMKMRIANSYYLKEDLEKAKQLYKELIDSGFLNDASRLKTSFFYNLFYNPKPFFVDKKEVVKDLRIAVEILSKFFPEMKEQVAILKEFGFN